MTTSGPLPLLQFHIAPQIVACNEGHAIAQNGQEENDQQMEGLKESFEHVCLQCQRLVAGLVRRKSNESGRVNRSWILECCKHTSCFEFRFTCYSPVWIALRIAASFFCKSGLLSLTVDKSGVPINIKLVSGNPLLSGPSIEAAKQWRYKPYLVNGNPVEVLTENTFEYPIPCALPRC